VRAIRICLVKLMPIYGLTINIGRRVMERYDWVNYRIVESYQWNGIPVIGKRLARLANASIDGSYYVWEIEVEI